MSEFKPLDEEALWRKDTVILRTGLSSASIARMEEAGNFPARRVIGENAVAWLASEIIAWMQSRPTAKAQPLASNLTGQKRRGRKPGESAGTQAGE